jgi:hypothetical protein
MFKQIAQIVRHALDVRSGIMCQWMFAVPAGVPANNAVFLR